MSNFTGLRRRGCLPWLALSLSLALAIGCYWPGLRGGFLFDDFVNLDALGSRGPIDNAAAFWRYITSGTADPIGRPLALLSFLLDARDWPADPGPFLRTNLAIHLLNGTLLFLLLRALERRLHPAGRRTDGVAWLGATLWLLHPLWVSTTLYIVQREAMLPATVTLATLLLYLRARDRFESTQGERGGAAMVFILALGTLAAMACKANGVLLPALAAALVYSLGSGGREMLTPGAVTARLRRVDFVALALPTLLILAYLASFLARLNTPMAHRPWTVAERLLTEPRVLLDYLGLLWIPRSVSTGLFNDGYVVSRSLWEPASTLPALMALAGLLATGLLARTRAPRLSAAILFFCAGHLLESSTVPLELYFEHRNYLPAMLMFWPLAGALADSPWRPTRKGIAATAVIALLATTTWLRSAMWGEPDRLAALWAKRNPDSSRAQAMAAISLVRAGRPAEAVAHLEPLVRARPTDLQIQLNYLDARCATGGIDQQDAHRLLRAFANYRGTDLLVHQWLSRTIGAAANGECGLSLDEIEGWLDAAASNPNWASSALREQTLEPLRGQLALARGDGITAQKHYQRALFAAPNPDFAARLTASLASSGHPAEALALLDAYQQSPHVVPGPGAGMPWLHAMVLDHQRFWPHEFAVLRDKLHEDLASKANGVPPLERSP